jgi:hypothetical protein
MSAIPSAQSGAQKTPAKTGAAGETSKDFSSSIFDDTKSLSDYVLVKKGANMAMLSQTATQPLQRSDSGPVNVVDKGLADKMLRNSLRSKNGKGRLQNLKIDLWTHVENNSGSNAANTAIVPVDPVAAAEFSSLSALYDEMIVHGVTVYNSVESAGGTAFEVHWNASYDPVDATAYALYTTSLSASQKSGPQRASGFVSTSLSSPFSMTKNGHVVWKVVCPKGASKTTVGSSTTDNLCTGQWVSTQAVSQAYYGFIKPFVEAGGTSVITALATTLCMHCEFRSRT